MTQTSMFPDVNVNLGPYWWACNRDHPNPIPDNARTLHWAWCPHCPTGDSGPYRVEVGVRP